MRILRASGTRVLSVFAAFAGISALPGIPAIAGGGGGGGAAGEPQARLVAQWMSVGFLHGVLNTDNTAISGQTLDYGPCAWLEDYHEGAVFSSIDTEGRYRFGAQPQVLPWNLARFAEALLAGGGQATAEQADEARDLVAGFAARYRIAWTAPSEPWPPTYARELRPAHRHGIPRGGSVGRTRSRGRTCAPSPPGWMPSTRSMCCATTSSKRRSLPPWVGISGRLNAFWER